MRDRFSTAEALDRQLAPVRVLEQVDLVGCPAEQLLLSVPRHFQKALVDLDEAEVVQPANDSRRGIGCERLLEALFRLEAIRRVFEDQHKTVGIAVGIIDDKAADVMHPFRLVLSSRCDLDHDVVESLATDDPLNRILACFDMMVVAVLELKIPPVFVDG